MLLNIQISHTPLNLGDSRISTKTMEPILEQYWRAVQNKVCVKCIDSDGHGNRRLSGEDECGLKFHFPRIVEAVFSIHSDRMEPYIEALRHHVCAYCKHQSPDGRCTFRAHLNCGLDRYFPLVVDVIESVRSESDLMTEAFGD